MSRSNAVAEKLAESQVEKGAPVLARALKNDPLPNYILANNSKKDEILTRFYKANIRMGLLYGEVFTIGSLEGLAIWLSPGNSDFTFGQLVRSGLLQAALRMSPSAMARFMSFADFSEKLKKSRR